MALAAHAEDAQDIASEFLVFQDYLPPEAGADISALATELLGIKTALLELQIECKDPRNHRGVEYINDARIVVLKSLEYTFQDTHRILGGLGGLGPRPGRSENETFRIVWRQLDDHFHGESRNRLVTRLQYFKIFLHELTNIVVGHHPHPEFEELFDRIEHLLTVQEDTRLADDFEQLAVGTPRQARSWERRRPYGPDGHGPAPGRVPQREPAPNFRPSYRSTPKASGYPNGGVPLSPIVSGSSPPSTVTTSSVGESSICSGMPKHWLADIWAQSRSNTQFRITGNESACFGDHARNASRKLREEHTKLVTLPFEPNTGLEVRIYLREKDRRARIWCRTDSTRGRIECVQPIGSLLAIRKDSCLQLCKLDSRHQHRLWANLRFLSYERLILFHSSMIALKAQEESGRTRELVDYKLKGEIEVFSAKIQDDNYLHALQLFIDDDSRGVRLLASVLRGPLKRSPVWTAFIKYNMMARDWISRREPKKVLLAELCRYIFTDRYSPQMAPTGEHELHFESAEDATRFVEAIEDVAEGRV